MTRFVPGERAVVFLAGPPSARSSSGWRKGSGSCAATPVRAGWSCTRPIGRARRSSGRRPRARPRRCSTFTPARSTICGPTFARSPPKPSDGAGDARAAAQARGADRRVAVKRAALVVVRRRGFAVRRRTGRRLRPLHVGQWQDVQVAADLRADRDLPERPHPDDDPRRDLGRRGRLRGRVEPLRRRLHLPGHHRQHLDGRRRRAPPTTGATTSSSVP